MGLCPCYFELPTAVQMVLVVRGEELNRTACKADWSGARRRSITEGSDTCDCVETFDSFDTMGLHEP